MRYLSLFSGVEAASVAWEPLGWTPLAFAEIDEFPSAVLAYRYPNVPNLGDVAKIDWSDFHERYGTVDVLVGGSPCQSFSIAGNREGLAEGAPSRLMFEYIRAVRELLQASGGGSPRYILWENVPGALSSERGNAFGQLLAELDECGYGLAWRVFDTQFARVRDGSADGFFGPLAQRRRRVFLVGVLGSPNAAEILFERTSLRWDNPSSREAREAFAGDPIERAARGGCAGFKWHQGAGAGNIGYEENQSPTLVADYHNPAVLAPTTEQPIAITTANTNANGSNVSEDGVSYTLDGANSNAVAFAQNTRNEVRLVGGDGGLVGTIAANPDFHKGQGGSLICMESAQSRAVVTEDSAPTLNASHEQPIVCMADDNAKAAIDEDICGSLKVGGGSDVHSFASNGNDFIGPICARDYKGVGNEYFNEGKVICQTNPRATC